MISKIAQPTKPMTIRIMNSSTMPSIYTNREPSRPQDGYDS